MNRSDKIFILIFSIIIFSAAFVFAQEETQEANLPQEEVSVDEAKGERLTQEEFAVELVRNMHLEGLLPTAALASDCVALLERLGISPLGGWENKALLHQEDYLVILAKAHGRETLLHQRAIAVEEKNIEVINKKWQEAYDKTGQWMSLSEFLADKNYFPEGELQSPYKLEYEDRNNDHKIDPHFLPVVTLIKVRDFLSYK